jgi:Family of unknown function (DUF5677)
MSNDLQYAMLLQTIKEFVDHTREELKQRWKRWPVDLAKSEIHEAVGALLARQVTLATQLALSPSIWNGHIAPLLLRAMADVYITLAWILKTPDERARKFILYGLGQEKLQLEHRKTQIADRKPTPEEQLMIDASEAWINAQRFTFLTEVNLGSWSGLPTREMADQAGCLDFYSYVYMPFSACAHSMWHHIARYNLIQCSNPLHQYHWVPQDRELGIDPDYLYLAAKYLQKAFATFDETLGIVLQGPSAFEKLCDALEKLAHADESGEDQGHPEPRESQAGA